MSAIPRSASQVLTRLLTGSAVLVSMGGGFSQRAGERCESFRLVAQLNVGVPHSGAHVAVPGELARLDERCAILQQSRT